tara:strand:- start:124 stop:318 length:195 start_codon:yes stop_codon:yes gene_type:complete
MDDKNKQHQLLCQQASLVLRNNGLSDEHVQSISKDLADVILTSWDLKLSNMEFASTWFNEPGAQ